MFQYEYEKRPASAGSCSSQATMTTDWSRVYPKSYRGDEYSRSVERARRPLPPRPGTCVRTPSKTTVPLKVWIIASASCFAVCAALVLATVVITKWGSDTTIYTQHGDHQEPIYANLYPKSRPQKPAEDSEESKVTTSLELEDDLQMPILEKISMFKNIVANREKNKQDHNVKPDLSLLAKPQLHPLHDDHHINHEERRIEKKDQAKYPLHLDIRQKKDKERNIVKAEMTTKFTANDIKDKLLPNIDVQTQLSLINEMTKDKVPDFKPTLPDVIKMVDGYMRKREQDYEEYYNDENLYDDYMQSNTMTSYLIEKVQELHDWISTDPELSSNATKPKSNGNEFTHLLKALNESLIEGNVTIIMNKLKDMYFGDNYTVANHSRKVISSNSTDLLSFGILTLDIMLLHNIQLMAWENQEAARAKMLKDPDVFAFNALFLEPGKVEAVQAELYSHNDNGVQSQRQTVRHEPEDYYDIGKNLLENILEVGMSTARAAIHLGRAYKNTKIILNQLSNRDTLNSNIQQQISRNSDANTQALRRLQTSYNGSVANMTYTELDCVWLLYCRNLMVTAKLNAPYNTMARINGLALRMLTGELPADKAIDIMLYEALTGWTDLRCNDMFPRCAKANAASVVMDSILQPLRKSQSSARS